MSTDDDGGGRGGGFYFGPRCPRRRLAILTGFRVHR